MKDITEKVFNFYELDCPKTISVATTAELFRRIAIEKGLVDYDAPPVAKKVGRILKWGNAIPGYILWTKVTLEMIKNDCKRKVAIYNLVRTQDWEFGNDEAAIKSRYSKMQKSMSFVTGVLDRIPDRQTKINFLQEHLKNFENDLCVFMPEYPNPYLAMLNTEIA